MKDTYILAIESSCDESAVAIIKNGNKILSSIVASQIDIHMEFGGVIPEVASRIHVENISKVIEKAINEADISMDLIDAIAYTQGPGLIGCLQVGGHAAKTLAWMYNKPLVPVHHIAGHIYANALVQKLEFPLLCLVVSGGHTELVYMRADYEFEILGMSQDDAIGEAGDKIGRVLGLPYPGGVYIDKEAVKGQAIYKFTKPKTTRPLDFSFSGLKSNVCQFLDKCKRNNESYKIQDVAASYQECAFSILVERIELALAEKACKQVLLAGGVAANSCLRNKIKQLEEVYPEITFIIPPLYCCTDNAAMIGVAGTIAYQKGIRADFATPSKASLDLCLNNTAQKLAK